MQKSYYYYNAIKYLVCFNKIIYLVIAVDIDPNKIKMARHNAEIWGVAGKIYSKLKADVVFMSPPWRGPGYSFIKCYSVEIMSNK